MGIIAKKLKTLFKSMVLKRLKLQLVQNWVKMFKRVMPEIFPGDLEKTKASVLQAGAFVYNR